MWANIYLKKVHLNLVVTKPKPKNLYPFQFKSRNQSTFNFSDKISHVASSILIPREREIIYLPEEGKKAEEKTKVLLYTFLKSGKKVSPIQSSPKAPN